MVFHSVSRGVTKQLSPVRRRRLMEELAEICLPKPAKLATGLAMTLHEFYQPA
jgi:hypothetical protein